MGRIQQLWYLPLLSIFTIPSGLASTNGSDLDVNGHPPSAPDLEPPESTADLTVRLLVIGGLVLCGGLLSGLTLGLMSLDSTNLEILEQSGAPKTRKYARAIKPIRRKGHWLLVTLLLTNTIINESLPIFIDSVPGGEGLAAVVISTSLILIFGEVIPQAICTRYGLAIGAAFAWPVRILMFVMSPLGYPIAKLLDWALGETEGTRYRRAELKALVQLHENSPSRTGALSSTEVGIIRAVLELRDKKVPQIMTPLEDVFMLHWDQKIDVPTMQKIMSAGHSRLPIFVGSDRRQVVGMILTKRLIAYDPARALPVHAFADAIQSIPVVDNTVPCFDVLALFQGGRSHMAVVVDNITEIRSKQKKQSRSMSHLSQDGNTDSHPNGDATQTEVNQAAKTPFTKLPDLHHEPSDLGITQETDLAPEVKLTVNENNTVELQPGRQDSLASTKEPASETDDGYVPNVLGIITLEDVIEELLGSEIIDETDVYVDMHLKNKAPPRLMPLSTHLDKSGNTLITGPRLGPDTSYGILAPFPPSKYEIRNFDAPRFGDSPRRSSRKRHGNRASSSALPIGGRSMSLESGGTTSTRPSFLQSPDTDMRRTKTTQILDARPIDMEGSRDRQTGSPTIVLESPSDGETIIVAKEKRLANLWGLFGGEVREVGAESGPLLDRSGGSNHI